MDSTHSSKLRNPATLGAFVAIFACACGGDLPGGHDPWHDGQADGAACVGTGCASRGCADKAYAIAVSLALDAGRAISDLDVDFAPQREVSLTASAQAPAKGSPQASSYWVATLVSNDGAVLANLVFQDPRFTPGNAGAASRSKIRFAMPLAPGAAQLRIENWDTGKSLIQFDLRGHLQLLCLERACLSICQAPSSSFDAGARIGTDGGVDAGPGVDAGAADANQGADQGADSTAQDAALAVDGAFIDVPASTASTEDAGSSERI